MNYMKFAAMIVTSAFAMYGLMYLNTYSLDHVFFSQTRLWMTLIMAAAMAVIMLLYMRSMYRNSAANLAIIVACVLLAAGSLYLVRSQALVGDLDYMRAMIPHHSIAILTSENAKIRDPRVRELADGILAAQKKEIGKMKALIADLELHPTAAIAPVLEPRS